MISTEEEEIVWGEIIGNGHNEDAGGASGYIGDGDGRDGGGWQLTEEVGHAHQLGGLQIIVRAWGGGGGGGGSECVVEGLREVDGVNLESKHLLRYLRFRNWNDDLKGTWNYR